MSRFSCFSSALAIALGLANPAKAIDLTFTNRTGVPDDQVFIWFQSPIGLQARFDGSNNVVYSATSYSLAEIGGGIELERFVAGRVFMSVGAPFPAQTSNAVPPQFVNPSPPAINNSYNNFHQLVAEITLTPSPGDIANVTHIDWATAPVALRTFDASGRQLDRIGFPDNLNSAAYFHDLAALTGGGATLTAGVNAPGNSPTAATQWGAQQIYSQQPSPGEAVRILSPTSNFILDQRGLATYPSFKNYVDNLRAEHALEPSKPIAVLEGRFFGADAPTYRFTVDSIDAPDPNHPAYDWTLGRVTMTGTLSNDPGRLHTIVIPYASFSDTTIYGGTTGSPLHQGVDREKGIGYGIDGVLTDGGANTAFTLPVRDFLAGLNYGYVGSDVVNPNDPLGRTYGESPSQYWGSLNLVTTAEQIFKGFDEVQPDHPYYNSWAKVIHDYSEGRAYGFSYDDTFAHVGLGAVQDGGVPVARLDVVLLPLANLPTAGSVAVPEVGGGWLIALALVAAIPRGVHFVRRRRPA